MYEVLRAKGVASNTRLYSPKLEKTMKFVAHDATIGHDFIANKGLYIETLRDIVNAVSVSLSTEHVASASGFLSGLADEKTLLDLHLLAGVTRILKRFSTEFQVRLKLVSE